MIQKYSPKQLDNFHILTWLLKDLLWAKECAVLATIMIIPTIGIALLLTIQSMKYKSSISSNFAILCWMTADSIWMVDEFYQLDISWLTASIFAIGVLAMLHYYLFICDIFKLKSKPIDESNSSNLSN